MAGSPITESTEDVVLRTIIKEPGATAMPSGLSRTDFISDRVELKLQTHKNIWFQIPTTVSFILIHTE
jgi:hypothetical protein